jgi:hypothetical protein
VVNEGGCGGRCAADAVEDGNADRDAVEHTDHARVAADRSRP